MGNVTGRKDGAESSGAKDEEEYMEYYAHGGGQVGYQVHAPFPESMAQSPPHSPRAFQSPLNFSPQVPIVPLHQPGEMTQNQTVECGDMPTGNGMPTMITWSYDGDQVAVEGSWDNWMTREFLQRTGREFSIIKVLPSGVFHFQFIVDGHYRYDPDLPQERDDRGNVFNILDLQDQIPEVMDNICMNEAPSSPVSSYNSIPFSLEDFQEKLPDLPPLLQKTPLNQPSSSVDSRETLEKPLPAMLNHLYIEKGHTGHSMVALGSTHRFRTKYVTTVLYKSLKNNPKR